MNKHGYTLLEILVAIGAVAIVGSLIAQVFFTTTRTNTKSEIQKEVKQNGDYAVEIMERMIRNSLGVTSTCTSGGTTLSTIEIKNSDGQDTQFGCVFDSGVSRIASTSATTGGSVFLTGTNVTTGGTSCADTSNPTNPMTLQFVCTSNVDSPPSVQIQFTLSQAVQSPDQTNTATLKFQTTVSPRN